MNKSGVLLLALNLMVAPFLITIKSTAAENEPFNGSLSVESPTTQTVYNDTMPVELTIAWSINAPIPWMSAKISYTIDNHPPPIAITNDTAIIFHRSSDIVYTYAACMVDVSNLAVGKHRLYVVATGSYNLNNDFVIPYTYAFAPIIFYVGTLESPEILVLSPQNRAIYNGSAIPLTFAVDVPTSWMGYTLDDQNYVTVDANTTLTGLTDGLHSLVVYANDTAGNMGFSERVTFTVATPPKLGIVSPQNKTYSESNITIVFTSDKPLDYAWYSFNGQVNGTVNNSSTITGLFNGTYSIVVYANDTFGNSVTSETVYFTVNLTSLPEPAPELFDVTPVLLVSVSIAIFVVACFLVYRKHKGEDA